VAARLARRVKPSATWTSSDDFHATSRGCGLRLLFRLIERPCGCAPAPSSDRLFEHPRMRAPCSTTPARRHPVRALAERDSAAVRRAVERDISS